MDDEQLKKLESFSLFSVLGAQESSLTITEALQLMQLVDSVKPLCMKLGFEALQNTPPKKPYVRSLSKRRLM